MSNLADDYFNAVCNQSCSAAGYDPTACAQFGCQALNRSDTMAAYPPENTQAYQPSKAARDIDRASALKAASTNGGAPLANLGGELDRARARVYAASEAVAQIADRLLGSEPKASLVERTGGADEPPRQGTAWQLNDQTRYIHGCIDELEREISRLSPLVAG